MKRALVCTVSWGLVVVCGIAAQAAGVAAAADVVIDNGGLSVAGRKDGAGLTLASRRTGAAVELRLLDAKGVPLAVKGAEAVKAEGEGSSLKVSLAGGEAQVTLGSGSVYAEIKPTKGVAGVSVGVPTRFAVSPDFFAMDVVLDARRIKQDKATLLADNFYLLPLEGGNGVVFCVWPGADPKEETREEAPVALTLVGEGDSRMFTESRVAFPGSKPVYVALLEGTNYWRFEPAEGWTMGKSVKSAWTRPFEARWRASFLTQEGKTVADWGVTALSFYFPEQQGKRSGWYHDVHVNSGIGWTGRYGEGPEGAAMGMGHYPHPCWFKDQATWLFPYVAERDLNAVREYNRMEQALAEKAKKDGRPYAIYTHALPNVYEAAILYPIQRAKDTPLEVMTPADVVRDTLGVGPCEYILDKEGAVWAYHGGQKKMHFEGATCGNWDTRLAPLLNEWQKAGEQFPAAKKQDVLWLIEDMGTFIEAVNARIHAYRDCLSSVSNLCAAAGQGNKEDAALAAALQEPVKSMQRILAKVPEFDKGLRDWQDRLKKYGETAQAATTLKPELMRVGDVRGFAEEQDNTIAGCRRCVNRIKQAAGMAVAQAGGGSASLAAKIREECRMVLRKPHPLEHF